MSMQAITYAMTRDFDGPRDGLCLYCVAHHVSNENGCCYAGQKLLAKEMHASQKTVQRALKNLEELGFIARTPRHSDKGRQTTDTITLVGFLEWLDQIEGRSDSHPYREGDKLTGGAGLVPSPRPGHQGVTPRTGLLTKSSTEDSAGARDGCDADASPASVVVRKSHDLCDALVLDLRQQGRRDLADRLERGETSVQVPGHVAERLKTNPPKTDLTDRSKAMAGDV